MERDLLIYAYEKELDILRDMSAGVGAYTEEEFFRVIKNTVHSLLDCVERIQQSITSQDKEMLKAYKFVNNCLKHDNGFNSLLYQAEGGTWPAKADGTARFYHYNWANAKEIGQKCHHKDQMDAYVKYLQDEPIIYKFEEVDKLFHNYIKLN